MKNDTKILVSNTIYLYIMNFVKIFFPLFTLPYLTRVLSTSAYGVVGYTKSLIVYVQLVLDFGFMLSATKKIVKFNNDKEKISYILGNTIAEKIILAILISLIYIIAILLLPLTKNNILFCIVYLFSSLMTIFILDFLYRGIEKMQFVTIPYVISKIITLICTFTFVKMDSNILFIPLFELIGNICAAIFSFSMLPKVGITIKFANFKKWFADLKESLVFFISNFATTIFGALTTLIAGIFLSAEKLAFWSLSMQFLTAAKSLYNPLTNSLYPYMIKNKDLKMANKISLIMIIPMLIGSILVIFFNDFIITLVASEKYLSAGRVLIFLLPAFVCSFYSMLYGWPVLGAINKEKETTTTTVIAAVSQMIGLLILIYVKKFNIIYLAICCSFSEIVLLIARLIILFKNKSLFKTEVNYVNN